MKNLNSTRSRVLGATLSLAFLALAHCGSDDDDASSLDPTPTPNTNTNTNTSSNTDTHTNTGGTTGLPPEEEIEAGFEAPVITGKYMWSANADSNRVAVVDAETLRVQTLEAGFAPTYLAAVPTDDAEDSAAIVLNVLGENATLFRLTNGIPTDPLTFPTHPRANSWAISESGKWAVAWSDARAFEIVDPTDSFQDLTLVLIEPSEGEPRSVRRVAGYRPSSVSFDTNEENLIVVSEHGVTVIDLTDESNPKEQELVEVSNDGTTDPALRDVLVTKDGKTALVRTEGSSVVDLVTIDTGEITSIELAGAVTDLDLSNDGNTAVAVLRAEHEVVVMPIPEVVLDPESIETVTLDGQFGSVSLAADSSVGVLYTNAVPTSEVVTLQLGGDDHLSSHVEDLRAPVRGVWVAPSADHAVALLDPPAGSVKAGAFGVVPTNERRAPLIFGTDAPAQDVALGPESTNTALITVRDDSTKTYGAHVIALPTLQVDYIPLANPPLSVGIIPELKKGYVAQEHPEGQITFIDFPASVTDGTAPSPTSTTLTGFELAARVVYPKGNGN